MRKTPREMPNQDLRKRIVRLGYFNWQIAKKAEISQSTLCIWLREPLEEGDERRVRIEKVLDELEATAGNEVTA